MKLGRKRGGDKLYKQWVKHGALPPEAVPQKESSGDVPVDREKPVDMEKPVGREKPVAIEKPVGREKTEQRLRVLYILLGLGIFILCVGLGLILMQLF